MKPVTIRKNFIFDKTIIDKTSEILKQKNKNFTEIINSYFKAIIKEPNTIDIVEKKAKKRKGSFIGMLDGAIGDIDFKQMRKEYHENLS